MHIPSGGKRIDPPAAEFWAILLPSQDVTSLQKWRDAFTFRSRKWEATRGHCSHASIRKSKKKNKEALSIKEMKKRKSRKAIHGRVRRDRNPPATFRLLPLFVQGALINKNRKSVALELFMKKPKPGGAKVKWFWKCHEESGKAAWAEKQPWYFHSASWGVRWLPTLSIPTTRPVEKIWLSKSDLRSLKKEIIHQKEKEKNFDHDLEVGFFSRD